MKTPTLFIIPGACSFGSIVALEWLNIPYQIGITTPEIRASQEFLKINPTGKVAALKDGELVVGENLAILLYLSDKFPNNPTSFPVGSSERVKVYQWLSYLSATLHPTFGQVLFPARFTSQHNIDEFRQLAIQRLSAVLAYIDSQLSVNGFFICHTPTIVDGQAYGILRWANGFKGGSPILDVHKFPNISKFLERMEQQPAVKNALAIESEQVTDLINSHFAGYYKFVE